jgi:uncharacterized membrane protein
MAVSLALIVSGLVLYALNPASGRDIALGPLEAIRSLSDGNPLGLVDLGIMLLVATPLARVVVALVSFAKGSEWKMVAISAAVLAIVAFAIIIGGK